MIETTDRERLWRLLCLTVDLPQDPLPLEEFDRDFDEGRARDLGEASLA